MAPKDSHNPLVDLTSFRRKRRLPDRRATPTRAWSPFTFRGRRRAARREDESDGQRHFDRFAARDWLVPLAILLVGALDVFANAVLHARGGSDPCPLTAWASSRSIVLLGIVQLVPLAALSFGLLLYARYRMAHTIASIVLLLLGALALWHGWLAYEAGADAASAIVRAERD